MRSLTIALLITLTSCTNTLEKQLPGKWRMAQVFESGADVTAQHNPKGNRWIEFHKDGTFVSDGDPFGRNTGHWHIDAAKTMLYIDSDLEDDDSEWKIEIKGDTTYWNGVGTPRKEGFRLVHVRVGS